MDRLSSSERGFTLLEVIVAIVIISTLTAAFAPLLISSIQRIKWAGERMEELYAMQSEMEKAMVTESGTIEQELVIYGTNGYVSKPVKGKVIKVGDFVSFLSPKR